MQRLRLAAQSPCRSVVRRIASVPKTKATLSSLNLISIAKQHAPFLAGAPFAALATYRRQLAHHTVAPDIETIWTRFALFHCEFLLELFPSFNLRQHLIQHVD